MLWLETGASGSVSGLGRTGVPEKSEALGGFESLSLAAGCLRSSARESSWTGLRCWRGTEEGRSSVAETEAVAVEGVAAGSVSGMTKG